MNLSLTRQPIYNENFAPVGYEISYQPKGDEPAAVDYSDQDSLICRVLTHAFFGFGTEQLTGGKPIYAALTNMLLLEGMPELFPPDRVVFEIPPNLFLDEKLADYVSLLHYRGYHLTLKSYTPTVEYSRNLKYLNMFDTVCIDIAKYHRLKVKEFIKILRKYRLKLLAENVDTPEALAFAQEAGFDLFQGRVYGEPARMETNVSLRALPYGKLFNHLLTGRVNRALCGDIIREDPALTHMFLRKSLNSLHNRKQVEIEVDRGLTKIDDDKLRHWAAVLLLDQSCQDNTDDLVLRVYRRGLIMEHLASEQGIEVPPGRAFMFGIVSALDQVFGEDVEALSKQLALGDMMRDALLHGDRNDYTLLLRAVREIEEHPESPQLPPPFTNLGAEALSRILWNCQVNTEYIIRALEYTVPTAYHGNILR